MLRNFITDDDLKVRHPNLAKLLWSGQSDYSNQISLGFDRLMNDLHNLNLNPRKVMVPLDFMAPMNPDSNQKLAVQTITGSFYGIPKGGTFEPLVGWGQYGLPYVQGPGQFVQEYYQNIYVNLNQRRAVMNIVAPITGSWTVSLQGNDVQTSPQNTGLPDPNDPNWQDIPNAIFTVDSNTGLGEQTSIFYNQNRWYRVSVQGSGSISLASYSYENIFDDAIVAASLIYIFRDFIKEKSDTWDIRREFAESEYKEALETIHFMYDLNDDGILTVDDEEKRSGTITFVR